MKTAYQVFSFGVFLAMVVTIYAANFRGQTVKKNKELRNFAEEPLIMIDSFLPLEYKNLPDFRHLVIDCPNLDVMVFHSDTVSDARLVHQFKNVTIDDLFSFQLIRDTLYVGTRRDLEYIPIYDEENGGRGDLTDEHEHNYIKLGIRSPGLQSIRLSDQSMVNVLYRCREYPDSIFGQTPQTMVEDVRPGYLAPRLDVTFEGINPSALYLDVQKVNLYFPDLGPSMNTMVRLEGKTECLSLYEPSYNIGSSADFSTDTLRVLGEKDYVKGHILAQVNHYLEVDAQPRQRFQLSYQTRNNQLTKKIRATSYILVNPIE